MPVQQTVEKAAAASTVVGGGWLSLEALTQGLNAGVAIVTIIAGLCAIRWWQIKTKREQEGLERDRRADPPSTPPNTD